MKYDLSLIIPSIRPESLFDIYNQLEDSVGKYSFEMIYVGPQLPPQELYEKNNFKFYIDKGSPSRCFQLGTFFSEGEYIALSPDDGIIQKEAFEKSLELIKDSPKKTGMTLLYSEGVPESPGNQHLDDSYWMARTHTDQQLPGVLDSWRIAPMFMYELNYYRYLGGLDCRFEHVNMNTHDLAYRVQKDGGRVIKSPCKVVKCGWNPNYSTSILFRAYVENDRPLFEQLYSKYDESRIRIEYNNWISQPSEWPRRYRLPLG